MPREECATVRSILSREPCAHDYGQSRGIDSNKLPISGGCDCWIRLGFEVQGGVERSKATTAKVFRRVQDR